MSSPTIEQLANLSGREAARLADELAKGGDDAPAPEKIKELIDDAERRLPRTSEQLTGRIRCGRPGPVDERVAVGECKPINIPSLASTDDIHRLLAKFPDSKVLEVTLIRGTTMLRRQICW